MTFEESMRITFKRVAADKIGTYTAAAAIAVATFGFMVSGADISGLTVAGIALGGLAIKAPVSYASEQLKNACCVLSHLT